MIWADLHIHSSYSRATSRDCQPGPLEYWARRKGLSLIGTGDCTHAGWRALLREQLEPEEEGLYRLRDEWRRPLPGAMGGARPRFLVSGEISCIYKQDGRVRKVHNLILLPGLDAADALAVRLETVGNLHSDGRPILGLSSRDLCEIVFDVCPDAVFIPAHIWTPHFSLFGAYSGFDTIEACYGDMTPHIHALETGLSSDPPMNWRLSALDGCTLVSNSDAHSPSRLAREATVFDTELSYPALARALNEPGLRQVASTLEFFPEEGKYHFDGHRACGVRLSPSEAALTGGICPVCGKRVTAGVLHRVEELADRAEGFVPENAAGFESLVPLEEVVAASMGLSAGGVRTKRQVQALLEALGDELFILREAPFEDIRHIAGVCAEEGIRRLRAGQVRVIPGFDGEYGRVSILSPEEIGILSGQTSLFGGMENPAVRPAAPSGIKRGKKRETPAKKAVKKAGEEHWGLNARQWEAVTAVERSVAVTAGPGTGKTRTLVYRIFHQVTVCGVRPESIVAVTFTTQAAEELRMRLRDLLGSDRVQRMHIGTFHAVSLGLLPDGEERALIDRTEAYAIVEELLHAHRLRAPVRDVLTDISRLKSTTEGSVTENSAMSAAAQIREEYDGMVHRLHAMDFDDILLEALRLGEAGALPLPPDTRLLVDEFQDVNELQYRLVRQWGRGGIFAIGDRNQAIYGFRGADGRCFERLRADFPDTKEIRLDENYRSTPEILAPAQALIGEEALRAHRAPGPAAALLCAQDAAAEALFVAKEIVRMVGGVDMLGARTGEGLRGFSDIAVLYRTHRQAALFEEALLREGVPCLVRGRDGFLAEAPVRKAVAFFRLVLRQDDSVSLRALLRLSGMSPMRAAEAAEGGLRAGQDMKAVEAISDTIERYAPLAEEMPVRELIGQWAQENGLAQEESIRRLLGAAALHPTLRSLLDTLTLGTEGDIARTPSRAYSPDAVTLMTLHASKGLEFPAVFVCGVQKGLLPAHPDEAEEERRLLYVGMTRAKEELFLLYSGEPSPFLEDIPAPLLEAGGAAAGRRALTGRQLSLF